MVVCLAKRFDAALIFGFIRLGLGNERVKVYGLFGTADCVSKLLRLRQLSYLAHTKKDNGAPTSK